MVGRSLVFAEAAIVPQADDAAKAPDDLVATTEGFLTTIDVRLYGLEKF
jgi:hypothetical protein